MGGATGVILGFFVGVVLGPTIMGIVEKGISQVGESV
jgi:hypothetical protein